MTFKEDLIPILLKLFKNNSGEEGIIPSSFCKTSITLVLKSDRDTATKGKKKNKKQKPYRLIALIIMMQKSSTKYYQTNSDSMLKDYIP